MYDYQPGEAVRILKNLPPAYRGQAIGAFAGYAAALLPEDADATCYVTIQHIRSVSDERSVRFASYVLERITLRLKLSDIEPAYERT